MKKHSAYIFAIIAACACLCCAVAGVSYAMFTSDDSIGVTVSSGKADLSVAINGAGVLGRKVKAGQFSASATSSSGSASINGNRITLSGIAAGDAFLLPVTLTDGGSNVNYKVRLNLVTDGSALADTIVCGVKNGSNVTYFSGNNTAWIDSTALAAGSSEVELIIDVPTYADTSAGDTCVLTLDHDVVPCNVVAPTATGISYFMSAPAEFDAAFLAGLADGDVIHIEGDAADWADADISLVYDAAITTTVRGFKIGDSDNDSGSLTVNAPNGTVNVYNDVHSLIGERVAAQSLHLYGNIDALKIKQGRVVAEKSAKINAVIVEPTVATADVLLTVKDDAKVEMVTISENTAAGASINIASESNIFINNESTVDVDVDGQATLIKLPSGVTIDSFGDNLAYVDGTYYAKVEQAVYKGGDVYLKPGSKTNLSGAHTSIPYNGINLYANGANFNSDLSIDTYDYSAQGKADGIYDGIASVDIKVYDAIGLYLWGQRKSNCTVNIEMHNCHNVGKYSDSPFVNKSDGRMVYLTGTSGVTNILLDGCSVTKSDSPVYSNASGNIDIINCTFTDCAVPVNINYKDTSASGVQAVTVDGCKFIECGTNSSHTYGDGSLGDYSAPIRVVHTSDNSTHTVTVKNTSVTGTRGTNGDMIIFVHKGGSRPVYATLEDNVTDIAIDLGLEEHLTVAAGTTEEVNMLDMNAFLAATTPTSGENSVEFDGHGNTYVVIRPADLVNDTSVSKDRNVPNQQNKSNAQYYMFENNVFDLTIKNITFHYIPANWKYWGTQHTTENTYNAQLYFRNHGDLTAENCVFDRCLLTHFSTYTGEFTDTVDGCTFVRARNSYAVKDIRGTTSIVRDCTFIDCGGGIMFSRMGGGPAVTAVTVTGNTFKGVDVEGDWTDSGKAGTRALVQIANSGDYTDCVFAMTGNTATDCGPTIRQLNATLKTLISDTAVTYTADTTDDNKLTVSAA